MLVCHLPRSPYRPRRIFPLQRSLEAVNEAMGIVELFGFRTPPVRRSSHSAGSPFWDFKRAEWMSSWLGSVSGRHCHEAPSISMASRQLPVEIRVG